MSIYPPVRSDLALLLSQPRLDEYKRAAGGLLTPALELYAWNLTTSAAFFESIHYFEVALRNVMHEALTSWCAGLGATHQWYRDPVVVPLSPGSQTQIRQAVQRATSGGRPETPGRVVAELSLGFWWSLLASGYNRTLWQTCLSDAFVSGTRRERLHDSVNHIRLLRNRIAHHEPIHTRPLVDDYTKLLQVAERISPHLAWWIDTSSRVPAVLAGRPAGGT